MSTLFINLTKQNKKYFILFRYLIKKNQKMNFILSLASLTVLIALNVECQPLADSRNGYINFFTEMLNPSFRQHRGRLRPFASQIGSPVINVRGARDVSKQCRQQA